MLLKKTFVFKHVVNDLYVDKLNRTSCLYYLVEVEWRASVFSFYIIHSFFDSVCQVLFSSP